MVQVVERPPAPAIAPPAASPRQHWPGAALLPFLVLAAIGLLLRAHEVGERAYHHDESLHAVYSWYLYVGRGYVHDPLMHGPFQFHMMALLYFLFGDSDVTGRLAPVLYGTGLILLPYWLRAELGSRGAIAASTLLTIGPSFLYFSRFAREDIYLAFFTLGMIVGIFGWIRARDVRYLYFGSLCLILAFADKEATYIHGFVFVTFFVLLAATSRLHPLWQPAWRALRDISLRTWVECVAIFVVVYVLLFTTFLTNPAGLWSGSVGALQYWLEQHGVQRGGQPLYYYVILLALYEFVPVIFAVAAVGSCWFRGSLFGWFCAYWFVANFAIYSWAGEKMPWLLPHVATPLVLLAARRLGDWSDMLRARSLVERPFLAALGLGLLVVTCAAGLLIIGAAQTLSPLEAQARNLERLPLVLTIVVAIGGLVYLAATRRAPVGRSLVAASLIVLGFFYVRTSWQVTYAHGDIPVEMLVYVQSSPDIPWVDDEIERISYQTAQRTDMPILMDGGYTENGVAHESVAWPFEWYLRDYKNRRYFNRTIGRDVNLRDYPVVLVMAPNLDPVRDQLTDYVGQKYRLNWWYPEEYKLWQNQPGLIWEGLTDPSTRARLLKYLLYREPLNPLGAREFYFFVRKDIPLLGPAPSASLAPSTAAPPPRVSGAGDRPRAAVVEPIDDDLRAWGVGETGGSLLVEPKGVAVAPDGRVYVAEGRANRVTVLSADGSIAQSWGRPGANDGEFAEPWGLAVAPSGEVYVADTWNHRVQRFSPDGQHLATWGGLADTRGAVDASPGRFWGPRDVAIGPDGLVYVSDTGNKRIQVFDQDGRFVRAFGGEGSEPGRFNEPVGIAFQGNSLLVADAWNGRIQRLAADGQPLGSIPVQGWESRSIANKPFVAAAADGTIYATAPDAGAVIVVSADGQTRSLRRSTGQSARLGGPTGVELGPNGALFVSESAAGVVSQQGSPTSR